MLSSGCSRGEGSESRIWGIARCWNTASCTGTSPYNLLFDGAEVVVIDVPQAMDLYAVPDAYSMMTRDLSNLDRWFEKQGQDVAFTDLLRSVRF